MDSQFVLPLADLRLEDLPRVGGKNASLGEMIRNLRQAGVHVPGGFALTVEAYRAHLEENALWPAIEEELERLDVEDIAALAETASGIRQRIAAAPLPAAVAQAAQAAYRALSGELGEGATDVAVRSSATAEDLPTASFAGQHESYLNVCGDAELDLAIRKCMASLFTDRAITYRRRRGIADGDVSLSVAVQKMVRSDLGAAGVLFTLDTESGFRDVVLIDATYGLGELLVQGRVNPDEYWVHKPTLEAGFPSILRKELGDKSQRLVYGSDNSSGTLLQDVSPEERQRYVLDDEEILQLARAGLAIEHHYSERAGHPQPMDVEWAKDGRTGEIFILQARPETVHGQDKAPKLELFKLLENPSPLVRGKSVGGRIGVGPVSLVTSTQDLENFREGDVLVAEMTDPDWEPVLKRAAAVVTEQGGRTCHAAIVSREHGIPCVVGTGDATRVLKSGVEVTVSCAEGDEGRVYLGAVPFERQELDPTELPAPPVPLMLNLANPDLAFHLAQLPCAGVGLMRIEFLVSSWIGIHPMALLAVEAGQATPDAEEIRERTRHHASPSDYFIQRLASGVAVVAAAFYPRPVTVRFSDFKTNEYAGLLGGAPFEPHEANPMLGFRGASRYYDERYRRGFGLECQALRRVRDDLGLDNVRVMIPFCRTLAEGQAVLDEMALNGLERGKNGLEVWVMCEIPNNVLLAEEFSALFDGFSIGSNDLTQLALGVDRDSKLLAHLFNERDPGVKRLITMVVEAAHRCGRPVGICGQAPSDYPDFAAFLVELGIDSISLTPDSLPAVTRRLAHGTPEG